MTNFNEYNEMSSENIETSKPVRLAVDATLLTTGLAIVGYVVLSVTVSNAPTIAGLGFLYGIVLAVFVDRAARHGGLRNATVGLFAALLFVPMLALLVGLPPTNKFEAVLLFFGVCVVPGSVLDLYRIHAD